VGRQPPDCSADRGTAGVIILKASPCGSWTAKISCTRKHRIMMLREPALCLTKSKTSAGWSDLDSARRSPRPAPHHHHHHRHQDQDQDHHLPSPEQPYPPPPVSFPTQSLSSPALRLIFGSSRGPISEPRSPISHSAICTAPLPGPIQRPYASGRSPSKTRHLMLHPPFSHGTVPRMLPSVS
jgi:hypothetical protein